MKIQTLFALVLFCAQMAFSQNSLFELRDGDRVVFIGDTLMEREQYYGYIELALAAQFPERKVSFRNLGWSGDTPEGTSRAGLSKLQAGREPADQPWKEFVEQIANAKPTVAFIGYGMANSFDGEKGVAKFSADLEKLLDTLKEQAGKDVRIVLLSPIRHENLGAPLPDPEPHNRQLALYSKAIGQVAQKRGLPFVSLFDDLKMETEKKAAKPLTDNGIHLNALGYQKAAEVIERGLGLKPGATKRMKNGEAIRAEILAKNTLYFDQSRPQNMAYILGFRKHEQGKNAADIPKFNPLLDAADAKISALLRNKPSEIPPAPEIKLSDQPFTPQPLPTFEVAPGFEVNLYAENPQLAKPIQMNFDAQGRLWVASSAVYPQIEPGQIAADTILVLEDTTGDGRADKSTVFAEGLFIPTAVEPGDGGVYVGQSTELLHFKDTNNDGKADVRKVVLSGFGTEDTHHTIHTLRWGMDGQLYFNQSIYIRTDTETPHGVMRLRSGGVLQLRPPTMELETFLLGFCNTWGHAFDRFGQSFTTDGCGGQGISFGIRGAEYLTYAKMRRELKSISPGSYPKFCGLELVNSPQFPDEFQNNAITCDFRAHRIVRFGIEETGAGYVTKELPDLLRTTNVTFRPIDVKFGPDGALYIADWSNPIIQHGEVDFRDPRRDHEHGRIWRVTAKGRPLVPKQNLTEAKNRALLDNLLSDNEWTRVQSRRVLTERGQKMQSDLAKWVADQSSEKALLEALWMYQSIDVVEPVLLKRVLAAEDGRIRAAAVRVLSFWRPRVSDSRRLLALAVQDSHPRVRLEAVRALGKVPSAHSAELVLSALEQPMDEFLDYGIWLSINELAQPWLQAIQSGAWTPEGREKQLEFGLRSIEPALASTVLQQLLTGKDVPTSGQWIELTSKSGGVEELGKLFKQTTDGKMDDAAAVRALNGLGEAARLRNAKPAGDLNGVAKLFSHKNDQVKVAAIKLAGAWKLRSTGPQLLGIGGDKKVPSEIRKTSFASLREMGGEEVYKGLIPLSEKGEAAIRQQAVLVLAALNVERSMAQIVGVLSATENEGEATELWRSLLNIKGAGKKIADALAKTTVTDSVAKAGLKVAREGGRNEPELVLVLNRAANIDDADKTLTPEEMKQLTAAIAQGDAFHGEKIYRRAELACVLCHAIGGAGGKVGPDLTSIGASAPLDYLIESMLFPDAKIKEGYHSVQITTKDEMEYSGIVVRETAQEIVLRDATDKEVSIPKSNVESRKNGASLMPSGLVDELTSEERADLFKFLSELGKPGPFDASKGNVARAWKLFVLTVDKAQFGIDNLVKGDTSVAGWHTMLSTVEGKVSKAELEAKIAPYSKRNTVGAFVAAKLQLASNTKARLKLNTAGECEVWANGKLIGQTRAVSTDNKSAATTESELEVDLPQGKHSIVVRLDLNALPETLRLESSEGTFLVE
ncbi:MAG: HEAT repeat domain-containing protein [Verrucomicrobia bacterium]|nr:HEAT repeat domain-containing protein [Verrucomicrobiota bacterium]